MCLCIALGSGDVLHAAEPAAGPPDPETLDRIVVLATRHASDPFEIPAPISIVDVQDRLRLGASPAELFSAVPGVIARDRHNYAQDTQISIRGFGSRSAFGVRGVQLYTDGIPATQPDGQGQVSHFSLASADRIEILRGPFSALNGNASGGVIQLFTADGVEPPEVSAGIAVGSFGAGRGSLGMRGRNGEFDYNLNYTAFHSDGFRRHSRAQRNSLNLKLRLDLHDGGRLTLVGNDLAQPEAQDPLGLTRTQFDTDPGQTADAALQFDTRKRVGQGQGGIIYEQPMRNGEVVRAMLYGGRRDVLQFLSIPVAAQTIPTHSGGVIDLDNEYGGIDLRWTHDMQWNGRPGTINAGFAVNTLRQHRRGFENFLGDTLGVRGELRRDEIDLARNIDRYLQFDWRFADAWSLLAGARHSRVTLRSIDRYVIEGNPDDSGESKYGATTPVAALMLHATPKLHLYASYGRGFETPTLAEVGYRADGEAGLAFDLWPVASDNVEIGAKWRDENVRAQLAVFGAWSVNELAVATSTGGRTTYQNIGDSRRRGLEVSGDWTILDSWLLAFAYTHLDARFTSTYIGCSTRCTQPDTPVAAGTRIPGVPTDEAFIALRWQHANGWRASFDTSYSGPARVADVDDASAPAYTLLGLEFGRDWQFDHGGLAALLRVDNLADHAYVGSIIVNDGNGRYYEPGPGRSWLLVLRWTQRTH